MSGGVLCPYRWCLQKIVLKDKFEQFGNFLNVPPKAYLSHNFLVYNISYYGQSSRGRMKNPLFKIFFHKFNSFMQTKK